MITDGDPTAPVVEPAPIDLNAPKYANRKYRMTMLGVFSVLGVFLICGVALFANPTNAAPLIPLATVVISAIGALVAVYSGTQAAVDWKASK
jgi:hypothetical protein